MSWACIGGAEIQIVDHASGICDRPGGTAFAAKDGSDDDQHDANQRQPLDDAPSPLAVTGQEQSRDDKDNSKHGDHHYGVGSTHCSPAHSAHNYSDC